MHTTRILEIINQANQIALHKDSSEIASRMLDMLIDIYQAENGSVFLKLPDKSYLTVRVVKGNVILQTNFYERINLQRQLAEYCAQDHMHPIQIDFSTNEPIDFQAIGQLREWDVVNALCFPIAYDHNLIGMVQLFNYDRTQPLDELEIICGRLGTEIQKAMEIELEDAKSERLMTLINVLGRIGSTLDQETILKTIIENARQLMNAEGCSLFLVDEKTRECVLTVSSNLNIEMDEVVREIRVPEGQGIIGYVTKTGETIIVEDVHKDRRHFKDPDRNSGFATQSLLATPMKAHTVKLSSQEDFEEERIIGGLEAVNKLDGSFTEEDSHLLQILASQAATILEIARGYTDTNELFIDITRALAAAIDAKDPYTVGHSLRVSEFSAILAEEVNMAPEIVQQVRLCGLLHDVGKIGIPDAILLKPSRLTGEEYDIIMDHPIIGGKIMKQVRKLQYVLPGLVEHHERLDGTGYPKGLKGDEISEIGRILAVADVFDALTSDRPYRQALSLEATLDYLQNEAGTHFDQKYVNALIIAYQKGKIEIQRDIIERTATGTLITPILPPAEAR
ncbi:MAG: GAF domain-containing protein [Anaerolineaceae bacterium]|nr:GAF domain-containing protein [Anaerolineaceae bacterium]